MPKPHQAPIPHFKVHIALALKVDPKGRSKYFIGKLDTLHPRILANFATFMTLSTRILGIKTYIKKKNEFSWCGGGCSISGSGHDNGGSDRMMG